MVNLTMLVCNRPRLTEQVLRSLNGSQNITVTISEDRKCDKATQAILSRFRESNPDKVHICGHCADYGTGELRNQVIAASEKYFGRGELLYLSDNDCFFYPDAIDKLASIYPSAKQAGYKIIAAYGHPYHLPIASEPIRIGGIEVARLNQVHAIALQSMMMDWETWDKYGPFDETPPGRVRMSEDVAFTNKVVADGGKLGVISPPLVVNTGITDSFGEKIPGYELVLKECPQGVICE